MHAHVFAWACATPCRARECKKGEKICEICEIMFKPSSILLHSKYEWQGHKPGMCFKCSFLKGIFEPPSSKRKKHGAGKGSGKGQEGRAAGSAGGALAVPSPALLGEEPRGTAGVALAAPSPALRGEEQRGDASDESSEDEGFKAEMMRKWDATPPVQKDELFKRFKRKCAAMWKKAANNKSAKARLARAKNFREVLETYKETHPGESRAVLKKRVADLIMEAARRFAQSAAEMTPALKARSAEITALWQADVARAETDVTKETAISGMHLTGQRALSLQFLDAVTKDAHRY